MFCESVSSQRGGSFGDVIRCVGEMKKEEPGCEGPSIQPGTKDGALPSLLLSPSLWISVSVV